MSKPAAGASNKCQACGRTAYETERVSVDGLVFHKGCLRCETCSKTISPLNCTALKGAISGHFYCKPCYIKAFKQKGNYDEGFGREQHKKNWAPAVFGVTASSTTPPAQAPTVGSESPMVAETSKAQSPVPASDAEMHKPGSTPVTPSQSPKPACEERPKAPDSSSSSSSKAEDWSAARTLRTRPQSVLLRASPFLHDPAVAEAAREPHATAEQASGRRPCALAGTRACACEL
eukprot:m51a1_g12937 hypothetical protein (233) ;mRNA; r:148-1695